MVASLRGRAFSSGFHLFLMQVSPLYIIPLLSLHRLCGKLPFHGEAGMKLEECIIDGHLTFREVEWINISEQGSSRFIAAPIRANRMVLIPMILCPSSAQTLIRGMLCKDTTRRLTALRVLNDAWFTVSLYSYS